MSLNIYLETFAQSAEFDYEESGWRVGNASGKVAMKVTASAEAANYPWEYEIIFGDPGMYRTATTRTTRIRDEHGEKVDKKRMLLGQEFNYKVIVKTFPDTLGDYLTLDLAVFDADSNGVYEMSKDRVFVGYLDTRGNWYKTLFVIEFEPGSDMPQRNDVYRMTIKRPFFATDSLLFKVLPKGETDLKAVKTVMDSIQVVPNPYVATNHMEPAVANQFLNQRRRILFTHLPARCTIKIFTVSGVLVDELDIENSQDNGTAFWDLLSKEGLDIAAGVYVYYVKAKETGDEKIGKFSIIK